MKLYGKLCVKQQTLVLALPFVIDIFRRLHVHKIERKINRCQTTENPLLPESLVILISVIGSEEKGKQFLMIICLSRLRLSLLLQKTRTCDVNKWWSVRFYSEAKKGFYQGIFFSKMPILLMKRVKVWVYPSLFYEHSLVFSLSWLRKKKRLGYAVSWLHNFGGCFFGCPACQKRSRNKTSNFSSRVVKSKILKLL